MSKYILSLVYITELISIVLLAFLSLVHQNDAMFVRDDRFTSDVNLEHYYVIEENALSNADVLLRDDYFGADEEEDYEQHLEHAPNLTMFQSIIDETKTVHRLAGSNLEAFLAHPVNMYHLFRRLDTGWREGLDLLLQTKPCKKWNLPSMVGRLRYLKENLPGKQEVERIVQYIAMLQKIHKLSAKEISKGKIGEAVSLKPLDIDEMFEVVKVLHDIDDTETALEWLHLINDLLTKLNRTDKEALNFNVTDVLNMMASAYYNMKDIPNALSATEKVLKIDPSNGVAQSNHLFFKTKLASQQEKGESDTKKKRLPSVAPVSKYERLCARKKPRQITRKKCRLVRVGYMPYKMEIIRHKPYIVLFHDVIRNRTSEVFKNYAHEVQTEQAWETEETFHAPEFSVSLDFKRLNRMSVKIQMKKLQRYMLAMTKVMGITPQKWEKLQIINVGLEGMHIQKHERELYLTREEPKNRRGEAGGFFVFLNEVKTGGEVVMKDTSITLRPEKGSVLFYYPTKTAAHSFCPVIGGSLWVAVQPMHEARRLYCVDEDEWL